MESKNIFKPILFNTEMVQAIEAGRKTQTRRFINVDNELQFHIIFHQPFSLKIVAQFVNKYMQTTRVRSKYKLGDILWVRETFQKLESVEHKEIDFLYKADVEYYKYFNSDLVVWSPSIHMPKQAARIFLKVTNVRCERLQDISNNDAMSEGILIERQPMQNGEGWFYPKNYLANNKHFGIGKYRDSFQSLWDSINAKKQPWKSNPWVWVYDFQRIDKPEDFNLI